MLSHIVKIKSNLDIRGVENFKFFSKGRARLYLLLTGFAAARIKVLAFNVAFTPACRKDVLPNTQTSKLLGIQEIFNTLKQKNNKIFL